MTKLKLAVLIVLLTFISPAFGFTAKLTSYTGAEDGNYFAANGEKLKEGMCAADWHYWPVGTQFLINGDVFRVTDCGSAVKGKTHLDIFCKSLKKMHQRGTIYAEVSVIKKISPNDEKRRIDEIISAKLAANKVFSNNSFISKRNVIYSSKGHVIFESKPKEEFVCVE